MRLCLQLVQLLLHHKSDFMWLQEAKVILKERLNEDLWADSSLESEDFLKETDIVVLEYRLAGIIKHVELVIGRNQIGPSLLAALSLKFLIVTADNSLVGDTSH